MDHNLQAMVQKIILLQESVHLHTYNLLDQILQAMAEYLHLIQQIKNDSENLCTVY